MQATSYHQLPPSSAVTPVQTTYILNTPTSPRASDLPAFSSDLFDCMNDCDSLFCACFCPCVLVGRNAEAMGDDCLVTAGWWTLLSNFGFCWLIQYPQRKKMRQVYGLRPPTSRAAEFMTVNFCGPCALAQEAREIKARGIPQAFQAPQPQIMVLSSPASPVLAPMRPASVSHQVVYQQQYPQAQPASTYPATYGQQQYHAPTPRLANNSNVAPPQYSTTPQ